MEDEIGVLRWHWDKRHLVRGLGPDSGHAQQGRSVDAVQLNRRGAQV